MTHHALVRRPSPRLADGLVTHIGRSPVDVALAQQQWVEYVAALEANGWATTEVAPAPGLPDSAFVEDTMVVFRDVVVAPSLPRELALRGAPVHDEEYFVVPKILDVEGGGA